MPNYTNSKIYKIISPSNPDMLPYFGATTQKLCKRMGGHRDKRDKCKSSSLIECGDAVILLVENYPCNSKEELDKREAEYILNNVCCNKKIPLRTREQYRRDNKEQIAKSIKKNYQDNKDKIVEWHKQYYQKKKRDKINEPYEPYNCPCGSIINKGYIKKHEQTKKHQTYLLTVSTQN